ncbi:VOC family protein [Tritonibacter horizontis]|uniref:Glyoxalase-like domain protein n=1 Tax=Tritonibacter horizontis TaxID=1768241 RepID=A0A132C1Q8_9RHOB|nr:VOC family protein [Tritonibacter horizontis]KUP94575.1 glyoxalase-like domain protein [Tritonibacter horizontis]
MQLGAFSISLNVKDLEKSRAFYSQLGFSAMGGDADMGYLIMKNGDTLIGLFQGMFDANILTFNPGWDQDATEIEEFDDVRAIQSMLLSRGLPLDHTCQTDSSGPAHIQLTDPDGNQILIDQHR